MSITITQCLILSKSIEKECDQQEKWYGTKYACEPLAQEFYEWFENPNVGLSKSGKKLDLPPPNIFIPENFEIFAKEFESMPQYPEHIYTAKSLEVWYKQDNTFKVPKASMKIKIYSNDHNGTNKCLIWV